MTVTEYEIRPGVYFDSVVLMQLQRALAELPGVLDAGAVMATPANRELLDAAGFDLGGVAATSDDLLIAVKAADHASAEAAMAQIDDLVKRRSAESRDDFRPKSLQSAVRYLPQAEWVLISVPGRYAADVADEALELGRHVFLYSDNVPLDDEIRLKEKGRENGLLLMGPDCGTAIVNGIGLGFANRVRRGSVGLVAASGTGLQAVTAGIHNLGYGVSQAIGTGGRDLKRAVGGMTTLQAIDLLKRDRATTVMVIVSKPVDPAVGTRIVRAAQDSGKPTVLNLIGHPPPARRLGNLYFAATLQEAAELAAALQDAELQASDPRPALSGMDSSLHLRGLFSGGTLAYEMLLGLQTFLAPIYSNIPLRAEQQLENSFQSQAHTVLDLGEDEFTLGRLHPMMDNDLRLRRFHEEAADSAVGLIVLDVVLGEGAHPDPASDWAPAIESVKRKRDLEIMTIVVGTEEDPQNILSQIERLTASGAVVVRNTSEALAGIAAALPELSDYPFKPVSPLDRGDGLAAINVGLESFYDSLIAQGAEAVHVDWRPAAGGKADLMAILARMKNA